MVLIVNYDKILVHALKIIISLSTTEQILIKLRIFTLCSLKLQFLHYFWYFQQNLLFHGIHGVCQIFSIPKGQFIPWLRTTGIENQLRFYILGVAPKLQNGH